MFPYLRLRWRRNWRRWRRDWQLNWHRLRRFLRFGLFSKWRQLTMIRRFAFGWWLIMALAAAGLLVQIRGLRDTNIVLQKLPGGSYSEALVGTVKNINPVLPENSASADAVRLIFDGLTQFDASGQLQPDLATDWKVSPDGKTYTFHLRRGVHWQDGVPFTAQDVVFTLTAIQNPDTRSPLAPSWQDVKVSAPNDYTVVLTLPKADTPFIDATTVGILPRHLLETIAPADMRVTAFNQHPIGTGPFRLTSFDTGTGLINLDANNGYFFGQPLLEHITLRLYDTAAAAFTAYSHRQVQGVTHVDPGQTVAARSLGTLKLYSATQPAAVAVFFQTTTPILKDKAVRQALTNATDRQAIIRDQLHGQAVALASPLVPSSPPVEGAAHQPGYNPAKANALLDAAGWKTGRDGIRSKNGTRLAILLVTQSGSIYDDIASELAKQWRQVGVQLEVRQLPAINLQQSYIRTRHYDALLYGINTGADPDVYAYWDSSQAKDPGLNLSAYNAPAADAALEAGRTLQDPAARAAKYRNFAQTWVNDAPAVMLYTPTYQYGVDAGVYGVHIRRLINPSDRFSDIIHWAVRVRKMVAQF